MTVLKSYVRKTIKRLKMASEDVMVAVAFVVIVLFVAAVVHYVSAGDDDDL